jgi:hypothetical protein
VATLLKAEVVELDNELAHLVMEMSGIDHAIDADPFKWAFDVARRRKQRLKL